MRRKKLLFIVPAALAGMVLFAAIGGEIVKLLWNWLVPAIFGQPSITFWQALGLLVLCRILFGGFGGHRSVRSNVGRRMREKWEGMTPDEREKFREAMRARWGFTPPGRETPNP